MGFECNTIKRPSYLIERMCCLLRSINLKIIDTDLREKARVEPRLVQSFQVLS